MKKYLPFLYLLFALLITLPSSQLRAEDVVIEDDDSVDAPVTNITLRWAANSEPDIAGYNVYYGRTSGDYSRLVTVATPTATIGIRGTKKTYFAVTAFNSSGEESPLSDEVHWP